MKAAIYHYTIGQCKHPSVLRKDISKLVDVSKSLGCSAPEIYCDYTHKKADQVERQRLLDNAGEYDLVIAKDLYRLDENTGSCFDIIKGFGNKDITTVTLADGIVRLTQPPLDKPLRVATYCCLYGIQENRQTAIQIQNDIFRCFIDKKTAWTLVDQCFDISHKQRKGEQEQLFKLISDSDKYDLLLVSSFIDINWKTVSFGKLRREIGTDIYSLQDGFLPYRGVA